VQMDLTDANKVRRIVKNSRPAWIFHLAAMASVGASFTDEKQTYAVNLLGSLNLLEASRGLASLEKLVLVSSGDCYGLSATKGKKLRESDPLRPISPYGVSKAAMEHLGLYHARQYDLPIVIVRPFNHTGPRQDDRFVTPNFCKQIAEIEIGLRDQHMLVGDLSARRDISDVRDIVDGYIAAAERGAVGSVYNLCQGRAIAVKTLLHALLAMSRVTISVAVDPTRLRKSEIPTLVGLNTRATKELGFRPRYSMNDTLANALTWWRDRVKATGARPAQGVRPAQGARPVARRPRRIQRATPKR